MYTLHRNSFFQQFAIRTSLSALRIIICLVFGIQRINLNLFSSALLHLITFTLNLYIQMEKFSITRFIDASLPTGNPFLSAPTPDPK